MAEKWRKVPGFPAYMVSSLGRLMLKEYHDNLVGYFSGDRTRHKTRIARRKSINVCLRKDGRNYWFRMSQLVLLAFRGAPLAKESNIARHLNDNVLDNRLVNLAWGSYKDNYADAVRNGRNGAGSMAQLKHSATVKGRPNFKNRRPNPKITRWNLLHPAKHGPDGRFIKGPRL